MLMAHPNGPRLRIRYKTVSYLQSVHNEVRVRSGGFLKNFVNHLHLFLVYSQVSGTEILHI
jgi:hypothetical protein